MVAKFHIKDDESGLVIGECGEILNLVSQPSSNNYEGHVYKITLLNFKVTEEFKKYSVRKKEYVNNIYITILNLKGDPLASLYFIISEPMFSNNSVFLLENKNIDLIGHFHQTLSLVAINLLEEWRVSTPTIINNWSKLTKLQRSGWLEAVRLYDEHRTNDRTQKSKRAYELDGTYVNDSTSFFCALGEAIYGPAGYFGFNLSSLDDCLYREGLGLGFSLIWNNCPYDNLLDFLQTREEKDLFYNFLDLLSKHEVTVSFSKN